GAEVGHEVDEGVDDAELRFGGSEEQRAAEGPRVAGEQLGDLGTAVVLAGKGNDAAASPPPHPEGLRDRAEGPVTLELLGGADEAAKAEALRRGKGLVEQEGLADPGFAFQGDDAALAPGGQIEERDELVELGRAGHEHLR